MSEQWYRNKDWNAEVEAEFEQRIARGRTQKAQHLMLQGQALIERHPDVAARLLERSIGCNDEFHLNQANCYLAMAQLALGNIEAALLAYEAALEAQLRVRFVQTSAPLDYAFAVAWFGRAERYPVALPILEAVQPSIFPGANLQADSARALILADLGEAEEARGRAVTALADFPDIGDAEPEWAGVNLAELRRRLESIAAA